MSVNGAFDARPVCPKGKSAKFRGGVPVRFDQNAICVIERSPEIMDRITKDGRRMALRFCEADFSPLFECALLILGRESFSVFRDVPSEKPFEVLNVMIGPFHLQ